MKGQIVGMIKRNKIVLIMFIIIISIVGLIIMVTRNSTYTIRDFDVNDYQYYIENFPSEENVGSVSDVKDVLKKAEDVWVEIYGEGIRNEKPYSVCFDNQNGVWLVMSAPPTSFFSSVKGGGAYIIIRNEDGEVLAVWHDK